MSAFRDSPSQIHLNANCVNDTDTDLYKAEVSDEDEANRKTNMPDTKEVPGM